MGAIISAVIGICKALPIVDGWVKQLTQSYFNERYASWEKEDQDAIRKLVTDHDQRPLEQVLGSSTGGKVSGDAGAVVVDHLPPNVLP